MEQLRTKKKMDGYLNTLGISPRRWEELQRQLSKSWNNPVTSNRRRHARRSCGRLTAALLRVDHPNGCQSAFVVRNRDISETGIGFLHGGFLHANTQVVVILLLPSGQIIQKPGRVVRCQYLMHMVHEVGVAFDDPLDLAVLDLDRQSTP